MVNCLWLITSPQSVGHASFDSWGQSWSHWSQKPSGPLSSLLLATGWTIAMALWSASQISRCRGCRLSRMPLPAWLLEPGSSIRQSYNVRPTLVVSQTKHHLQALHSVLLVPARHDPTILVQVSCADIDIVASQPSMAALVFDEFTQFSSVIFRMA